MFVEIGAPTGVRERSIVISYVVAISEQPFERAGTSTDDACGSAVFFLSSTFIKVCRKC